MGTSFITSTGVRNLTSLIITMDTRLGWILATLFILLSLVDTCLGSIRCHSCIADSNFPKKCTRPEYQGVFIKCPEDDPVNNPVNTCYKSVHKITGEVNQGCAPGPRNKNSVYVSDEGPWGEYGVTTHYCNKQLCNIATSILPSLLCVLSAILLAQSVTVKCQNSDGGKMLS